MCIRDRVEGSSVGVGSRVGGGGRGRGLTKCDVRLIVDDLLVDLISEHHDACSGERHKSRGAQCAKQAARCAKPGVLCAKRAAGVRAIAVLQR
eukprot:2897837-Prymnesium_polylepis.2